MAAMRWLLVKDLQILRRSPLLTGLLVAYPIALALMIGVALSSPPGKPRVAFYDAVPRGQGRLHLGSQVVNITGYAHDLFSAIRPLRVRSRAQAVAAVRSGRALAALVIPADITAQLESLVRNGVGSPTVQLYLNSRDPLQRAYVQSVIDRRISAVQGAVSKQVLRVAVSDLQKVLGGGTLNFAGENLHLLGLRAARAIVARAAARLPRGAPLRAALRQVISFASVAIDGLSFAGPALGSIGAPLTVQQIQLAGRTTPAATYAVAVAVSLSLMLVALLLAAALLALERSEHTYARLMRGLVSARALLAEKTVLAAAAAAAVALVLSAVAGAFVGLAWGRFGLWLVALVFAAVAFAALGLAIGAVARELGPASLLAFVLSLPIAFIALVPATAVSAAVGTALAVISFAFPFRSCLQALSNAFAGTSPPIGLPLVHLAVLAALFAALARLALRRFAA
jgi:ABC-type transport system involved in multi-copper enzyme maturation permease subunit